MDKKNVSLATRFLHMHCAVLSVLIFVDVMYFQIAPFRDMVPSGGVPNESAVFYRVVSEAVWGFVGIGALLSGLTINSIGRQPRFSLIVLFFGCIACVIWKFYVLLWLPSAGLCLVFRECKLLPTA